MEEKALPTATGNLGLEVREALKSLVKARVGGHILVSLILSLSAFTEGQLVIL